MPEAEYEQSRHLEELWSSNLRWTWCRRPENSCLHQCSWLRSVQGQKGIANQVDLHYEATDLEATGKARIALNEPLVKHVSYWQHTSPKNASYSFISFGRGSGKGTLRSWAHNCSDWSTDSARQSDTCIWFSVKKTFWMDGEGCRWKREAP